MSQYRIPVLEQFSWQPPVLATQNDPPATPAKGDRYVVGSSPTGAWVGHAKTIATYNGTGWLFDVAAEGWRVYDATANVDYVFDGTNWTETKAVAEAHATSHKSGGADSIKLDELASPTDNTNLNVSTSAHGLAPKAPNDTAKFLRGDGTWAVPTGGGDMSKSVYDTDNDSIVDKAEALNDGTNNVTTAQAKEAYDRRASYDSDYDCILINI